LSRQQEIQVEDDGLGCPEVGGWAKSKYRLIGLYDELFSKGMKNKWDQRVYIDLYSGAGLSKVRNTDAVLKGSPLLALGVSCPFDKYLFCEDDHEKLHALEARVKKISPKANCSFILGNCDTKLDAILAAVPRSSRENRVLSLCIVDPFDFGLRFATIQRLSSLKVDFLVLLAVAMDANRAYEHYVDGKNPKLDLALGNVAWRERWKARPRGRDEFLNFLAEEFAQSMVSLGYRKTGPAEMKLVRDDGNRPLYYLALFSKHEMAYKYWNEVLKYSTDQTKFDWS
jgi:three-Cys-motif partner protein